MIIAGGVLVLAVLNSGARVLAPSPEVGANCVAVTATVTELVFTVTNRVAVCAGAVTVITGTALASTFGVVCDAVTETDGVPCTGKEDLLGLAVVVADGVSRPPPSLSSLLLSRARAT